MTPEQFLSFLPVPLHGLNWQTHPLDGALLLFERDGGLNVLFEGEETINFQRAAPRTLLIAITNACNLTCAFCYRDLTSRSLWRYDTLLKFCQQAAEWGVLEVAFGGGEPMLFPHWEQFIHELHKTTNLCINFTTNGMLLTEDFLQNIAGKYGNIRVSLYEDNHWEQTIALLVRCRARFGVNWLITPDELPQLEAKFLQLLGMGVRDFLLLSYKGADTGMHLTPDQTRELAIVINRLHNATTGLAQIKLDVCWGDALPDVPRLFSYADCGAGDDFLSITSDRQIKPCSFHHWTIPFETIDDLKTYWQARRNQREAAAIAGCARLPERGMVSLLMP